MNLPRLVHVARDTEHVTRPLAGDIDHDDDHRAANLRNPFAVERPVPADRLLGVAEQAKHRTPPRVDLEDLRWLVMPGLVGDHGSVGTNRVDVN